MSEDRFCRADPNPVPLDQLKQPDYDVREFRTDEDIDNIARSLEEEGQVMPVLLGNPENGQYPVLDGNHRVLAARRAGWPDIDCIQTAAGTDDDKAQIIANLTRLELSPSEKLAVLDFLLNQRGLGVNAVADEVGIDKAQVSRYKTILTGFGEIRQFFIEGELGSRACYQLNRLDDRDRAVDIAERAVREGYRDADVVEQARYALGQEAADDVMKGAGGDRSVQNRNQVKANVNAMQSLDPIDEEAVQQAQQPPQEAPAGPEGPTPDKTEEEYDGPVCQACGMPREEEATFRFVLPDSLAENLDFEEVQLGANCGQGAMQFIHELQAQSGGR